MSKDSHAADSIFTLPPSSSSPQKKHWFCEEGLAEKQLCSEKQNFGRIPLDFLDMDSSNHSACKEFPFFSFQLYWIPRRNISCTTSWNKLNAGRVFMDSLISILFYVSFMARAAERETAGLSVYHFWKRWTEDLKGCNFNIIQQLVCIIILCVFNGKYLT